MLNVLLPTAGVTVWLPGLALLGIGVGFLVGMFGVGGGFIITPMLHTLFGVPYPVAVGSGLLQIFFNSIVAAFRHWRAGNIDIRLGLLLALGGLGGTEIGVRLMAVLGRGGEVWIRGRPFAALDLSMNLLFLLLLGGVVILMLRETRRALEGSPSVITGLGSRLRRVTLKPLLSFPQSGIEHYSMVIPLVIGAGIGVLTGLMGVGGGFLNFPVLIYLVGAPTTIAVGTSAFQVLFAGGFGALRHALAGNVDLLLAAVMSVGSFAGVQLGVWAVGKLKARQIRRYFIPVLGIGILVILWDTARCVWL